MQIRSIWFRPFKLGVMVLAMGGCATQTLNTTRTTASSNREVAGHPTPNYPEIFRASREIIAHNLLASDRKIQTRYRKVPESQWIEHLQRESMRGHSGANTSAGVTQELIQHISQGHDQSSDPSKHLRLIPPPGTPGYSELQMFVNHSYSYTPEEASQPVEVPAANLVTVWDQFLRSAVEQIDLNVFDFDLESIAQTLIEQGRKGVRVRVGIDEAESLNKRAEVQRIYQMLKASGVVDVVPVNSVGLNHQKMVAIDWENVENAKVLFSSGNLTQSCLDPEGDLKGQVPLPPNSIPNANHVITMQSWLLANLVHHELSKTLDPELKLRGAGYPMTGAYQVTGPQIERPDELLSEARPQHSLIISFTPGGGFKDINTHLIARLINEQPGPIRLVQFSFSSDVVGEALLERAQRAFHEKDEFDFLAIGDTSFAMRVESELLKISGLKLLKQKKPKKRYYVEDKAAPWFGAFNGEQWDRLRHKVFIAPPEYVSFPRSKGKGVKEPNAKIHHKVLSVGNFAIVGTSFNFSDSAQTNNEQILILHEPDIARRVDGMVRWLVARSGKTVYEEAQRRNQH